MSKSQNSFIKKQKADKKKKKQAEKLQKRLDRKDKETSSDLDDMIAYVDEFGNIVDKPVEKRKLEDDEELSPEEQMAMQVAIGEEYKPEGEKGIVKFFNAEKGFGFIKWRGADQDLYVQARDVREPIRENDRVTFEVKEGDRGLVAVDVRKV